MDSVSGLAGHDMARCSLFGNYKYSLENWRIGISKCSDYRVSNLFGKGEICKNIIIEIYFVLEPFSHRTGFCV